MEVMENIKIVRLQNGDDIIGSIITELDNCMIDVQGKQFSKDFIMVMEALRACIYRSFGVEHHMHGFIDTNIALLDSELESMSREELKAKIDEMVQNLNNAKNKLDFEETE